MSPFTDRLARELDAAIAAREHERGLLEAARAELVRPRRRPRSRTVAGSVVHAAVAELTGAEAIRAKRAAAGRAGAAARWGKR